MSKRKFKVGDKVRIKKDADKIPNFSGSFVYEMSKYLGKELTIKDIDTDNSFHVLENHYRWDARAVEPVNQCIVICRKENQVIALDKSTGKKAVAKCSPQDEFDFEVGAKIAFDRLVGNPLSETKPAYNGKFVVVKTESPDLTVGKIYEVVDGCFNDDDGCNYPLGTQITSFDDLKEYLSGDKERRIKSSLVFPHYSYAHTEIIEVVE